MSAKRAYFGIRLSLRRAAEHRASVEEQEVGEVDSGQLFRGGDPLRQFGELEREVDRQALEPFASLNRGHTGNDPPQRGLADLPIVIV